MHPLCQMCLYILALGSVLFALENIISMCSFHTLVTIHEPEQLTTCSSAGVSVPGRQNPPWEEQMSLNFGAINSFLKQRQNEALGKDNYKGKCQEIQDFVTNEVFRSSGIIVHKFSTFVCLSWIWQPGLLGTLKSEATLGTENLAAFLPFTFMMLLVFRTARITAFPFQNMIWQLILGVTERLSSLLMLTGVLHPHHSSS